MYKVKFFVDKDSLEATLNEMFPNYELVGIYSMSQFKHPFVVMKWVD